MIICVTDWFQDTDRYGIPYGPKKLLVSHAFDSVTEQPIITTCEHPSVLGAVFNSNIMEWVIYSKEEQEIIDSLKKFNR